MDIQLQRSPLEMGPTRYRVSLVALVASIGLLLFTIVEMRRAFLFPMSDYFRIGAPSAILYFDPRHLVLLAVAFLGAWLSYWNLARQEKSLKDRGTDLSRIAWILGLGLLVLLVIDLFIYRGVPASRIVAAGKIGVGQFVPSELLRGWVRPLGEGINYLALVWHATVLGVLIGALFLTLVAPLLRKWIGGSGFASHLGGSAVALGNPFCSCCAAPIGASLYRSGIPLGPALAFVVSSPMLNVTAIILAASLLPMEFALLRIIGGLVMGVLVTYLVSVLASRWGQKDTVMSAPSKLVDLSLRALGGFNRWFQFEAFLGSRTPDSPGALIAAWLKMAWKLGRVVVPVLFVGSVVTAAIVTALPDPTNSPAGVVVAAAFGTLLMVPTWTELPVALGLIREGLAGPAAALLITLPAVSIPCLVIVGAATANYRAALLLGLLVFVAGILAGIWFYAV